MKIKIFVAAVIVDGIVALRELIAALRELLELNALNGRSLHLGIRKGACEENAKEEGGAITEDR